jgi:hypothetical protein
VKIQFAERLTLSSDGYLLVPPAWHAGAEWRYQFVEGHSPWERTIASFPQRLLDRLLAHKRTDDARRRADDSSSVQPGDRHAHLLSIAGLMRYGGCCEETIAAALLAENERRCVPPKPELDVRGLAPIRATRRDKKPPSDEDIERGLRERAVSDPRAAEILLRWLQRPRDEELVGRVDLDSMSERELEQLYAGLVKLAALPDEELRSLVEHLLTGSQGAQFETSDTPVQAGEPGAVGSTPGA